MDFRELLSAQLPPIRPDEPAHLRQDILDELSDHLVCAYHRDILRGVDGTVAQRRVLEKFGDPAALACRLWLDAMRGKIMAQRVLIATCVLVTLACLASVGLFWQQSVLARQLALEQAALAQARENEMMQQLRAMSQAIQHPRSPDWNPVKIKLTEETPDGPPVEGATVLLTRNFENPAKSIQKESDASGIADFGSLNPGDYTFDISRDSREWSQQHQGSLNVQPGTDVVKAIICPSAEPKPVSVRVHLKWPADLEKEGICLCTAFGFRDRELGSDNVWTMTRSIFRKNAQDVGETYSATPHQAVLLGPSTKMSKFVGSMGTLVWTLAASGNATKNDDAKVFGSREWVDFAADGLRELKDSNGTIDVEPGRYKLTSLMVLSAPLPRALETEQWRYELLASTSASNIGWPVNKLEFPPEEARRGNRKTSSVETPQSKSSVMLPGKYWQEMSAAFEARPGQTNDWTIPIPDLLAQAVRDALKPKKANTN